MRYFLGYLPLNVFKCSKMNLMKICLLNFDNLCYEFSHSLRVLTAVRKSLHTRDRTSRQISRCVTNLYFYSRDHAFPRQPDPSLHSILLND